MDLKIFVRIRFEKKELEWTYTRIDQADIMKDGRLVARYCFSGERVGIMLDIMTWASLGLDQDFSQINNHQKSKKVVNYLLVL